MTIEEKILTMQHFADGGLIERYTPINRRWKICEKPDWNWARYSYRAKHL